MKCRTCGEDKTPEQMIKNRLTCKACRNSACKVTRARLKERRGFTPGHKRCSKCRRVLPPDMFHRDPGRSAGLVPSCSDCFKQLPCIHGGLLRRRYGIGLAEYAALFEAQSGACALCGDSQIGRRLAVDHCHETKKIRALLCVKCNLGLGQFKDSPELLEKAAQYLRLHLACQARAR